MLLTDLRKVDEHELRRLKDEAITESQTLDFKGIPHITNTPEGKDELAKDVCAFANADGGDIVIGVSEKNNVAGEINPILATNFEPLQRRYRETLSTKVDPPIHGIQFHEVRLQNGGFAAVLRVPPSYDGPHSIRVTQEQRRFVVRNGTKTDDMTIEQIHTAFDRTATLAERARRFASDRTQRIASGVTWRSKVTTPVWAAWLIPFAGLAGRLNLDMRSLYDDDNYMKFRSSRHRTSWDRTLNLDGLVVHSGSFDDGKGSAYVQVFRTGSFEAVGATGTVVAVNGRNTIPAVNVAHDLREVIRMFQRQALNLGFTGPSLLKCAVLNVSGLGLLHEVTNRRRVHPVSDRPHLELPEHVVPDIGNGFDVDAFVRPTLDVLWQAFGMPSCMDYNLEGVWAPHASGLEDMPE